MRFHVAIRDFNDFNFFFGIYRNMVYFIVVFKFIEVIIYLYGEI